MTVKVFVAVLPAASRAVTVITFVPARNATLADQLVVPDAVPLPPALLVQVTCVTPTLSEAAPAIESGVVVAVYVPALVGVVIVTVGLVASPDA